MPWNRFGLWTARLQGALGDALIRLGEELAHRARVRAVKARLGL